MSLFQWPFKRKTYAGLNNPRYVSDIQAANEAVVDALSSIAGLSNTDFAIIYGLNYTAGAVTGTGSYSAGIFFLNGSFYYLGNSFGEGNYLIGTTQDTMPVAFEQDGIERPIYTLMNGLVTANPTGASPQFSDNMNQYRIGAKFTKSEIITLQGICADLGNAATKNVGTTSGTVAAGDDPRLGYTIAQVNAIIAALQPAPIGHMIPVYDVGNNQAFLANFDANGIGIKAPYLDYALCDGRNNLVPNLAGVTIIGEGTYTDPGTTTTTTYSSRTRVGERLHSITYDELPALVAGHGDGIAATTTGTGKISFNSGGGQDLQLNVTGPNGETLNGNAGNNMQPSEPVYIAMKYRQS